MSEFHDPELRQELGRLSGPYPDDNAAFAAWQRRVGQVRRRRVVAWTSTAAFALVVGTVAFAAVQSPGRHTVVPGESADSSADVTLRIASTQAEVASTVPEATEPETSAPTTLAPETAPSVVDTAVVDTEAPEAVGAPPTGSASKGNNGTPSSQPQGSNVLTQTFASKGGSITVRKDGERLTIVATNPAPGFKVEDDDRSGERVAVTFKSDKHVSQISVKLSDGIMKESIEEHDDGDDHDTTVPHESDGGHGGGGGGGGDGD